MVGDGDLDRALDIKALLNVQAKVAKDAHDGTKFTTAAGVLTSIDTSEGILRQTCDVGKCNGRVSDGACRKCGADCITCAVSWVLK